MKSTIFRALAVPQKLIVHHLFVDFIVDVDVVSSRKSLAGIQMAQLGNGVGKQEINMS